MAARILGVHENAKPAATTTRIPGALWGREFVARPGGGPLPESTTEAQLIQKVLAKVRPHTSTGGGCVVSIKADMVSVGTGRWDSRLTAVGHALNGLDAIVVLWHEPEDDLTPQVFVPAHNRGREAILSGGLVEVGYCGMAYQWRPGSPTTADPQAWAQDLLAERYLLDVYFGKSFSATHTLGTHPGRVRWHEHMIAPYPGRVPGFGEWGRRAEPDRADGFTADFEWLATDPIGRTYSLAMVWNTGGTENDPGWVLDQAAEDAVRAGFARLAVPAGYRPSGFDGFYVCERSGCLVAAELVAEHDRTLAGR